MSKIALDLGFIQIYWYSICIMLALLIGGLIALKEIKKNKINEEFFINLVFYTAIVSLIGARLYYVAFNLDYYLQNPIEILAIYNGGMAIHGGLLFGSIFILYYTFKYKVDTVKIFDIVTPALLLGQAIGRWGNFFNQEAFGKIITREILEKQQYPEFIINRMYIDGYYRTPTFFYESVWNLFGFIFLLMLRKTKYIKKGDLTAAYMMWYSFGRFFIEGMRTDSLMLGPLRIAQIVSIVLFLIGMAIIIINRRKSRFENLYHEELEKKIRF